MGWVPDARGRFAGGGKGGGGVAGMRMGMRMKKKKSVMDYLTPIIEPLLKLLPHVC
jgi:hypothetical protein